VSFLQDRIYPSTIVPTYGAGKINWICLWGFLPSRKKGRNLSPVK